MQFVIFVKALFWFSFGRPAVGWVSRSDESAFAPGPNSLDTRATNKAVPGSGSGPRRRPVVSLAAPAIMVTGSGVGARRALPRCGSCKTVAVAPWSRCVSCGGAVARRAACPYRLPAARRPYPRRRPDKLFDAAGTGADAAFTERCEGGRHRFRFIVSPDDASELESLRRFTGGARGAWNRNHKEPGSRGREVVAPS